MIKQDILNVGWNYIGGFFYEWPIRDTIYVDEFSNRCLDFRLNFVDDTRYLKIEAYERNSFEWEVVYAGPCKSIDDLKWLMNKFNMVV